MDKIIKLFLKILLMRKLLVYYHHYLVLVQMKLMKNYKIKMNQMIMYSKMLKIYSNSIKIKLISKIIYKILPKLCLILINYFVASKIFLILDMILFLHYLILTLILKISFLKEKYQILYSGALVKKIISKLISFNQKYSLKMLIQNCIISLKIKLVD